MRTTGLFMHFLSVHLDLKRLCAFQSGFHFINEITTNNLTLFSLVQGTPPCNTTKQTALTQQNNSNTTRVKRAPKTILLGKEKPQITRKFMEAEEANEELHTPTHSFTHPQTRQMEHWCTRDHDHACDLP